MQDMIDQWPSLDCRRRWTKAERRAFNRGWRILCAKSGNEDHRDGRRDAWNDYKRGGMRLLNLHAVQMVFDDPTLYQQGWNSIYGALLLRAA